MGLFDGLRMRREAATRRQEAVDAYKVDHEAAVKAVRESRKTGEAIEEGLHSERALKSATAVVNREEKEIGKLVTREARAIEKTATKTSFLTRLGRDGVRRTVGKPALIGAGIVAGAAAVGIIATKIRGDRKAASKAEAMMADPVMDMPPAMPAPVDMSMMAPQAQTMMGEQPVEGPRAQAVKTARETAGSPELGA